MKSYDSQLACPQARRRVRPPLLRSFNDTRGKGDPGGLRAGKAHLASDDARIAGSQDDPTCTSWLQRLSLLTSPPDASIPAGGRSKTHWPPSNSAICNPSLSPCCGRWSRLGQNAGAQVLLGLMLLLGVSAETQAQTSITITSTRTSGPESHSLQQVNASHSISDWDGEGTYKFWRLSPHHKYVSKPS